MVAADRKTALHAVQILGLVVVAHHFWPKGITYGGKEDWEKAYRKKHANDAYRSQSRSRLVANSQARREVDREREGRYEEYDERIVCNERYLERGGGEQQRYSARVGEDVAAVPAARRGRLEKPKERAIVRYHYDEELMEERCEPPRVMGRYYDDEMRVSGRY